MESVHVCLLYAARSSLVLVDRNLCYGKLVNTVMTEFDLDPTKVAVTMSYLLNVDLPPIRINSDSNVLSYITLKGMERDPSKYSINIEVIAAKFEQQSIIYPITGPIEDNLSSKGSLFSLQELSSDICEAVVEPSGHDDVYVVTIVSEPDARNVEEGRVFCNKEVLKLSTPFMPFKTCLSLWSFVQIGRNILSSGRMRGVAGFADCQGWGEQAF
ncbi:Hypothetical predicted protein [Olea europaea subsp. europaea]|uniref:Uncharacterized protein n=1 Tax=Olea europaea subsp. europaea TaxID=158383 RepID=A0A8S0UTC7_OLEEU|nr:Hypothetical predicted protein [Olea europaea subsp. europaea]